jgi:hypothetical protein
VDPFSPEIPGWRDRLREWWSEASGRAENADLDPSRPRVLGRKLLLWLPIIGAVTFAFLLLGTYLFTGWRARDFAGKAIRNAADGELRLALVQAESARRLRGWDPDVLRAYAQVLAACDDPRSVTVWEQIGRTDSLNEEDRRGRMSAALRLGDDPQFAAALATVEAADGPAEASAWRARRALTQRDFTAAEKLFRSAVAEGAGTAIRLEFASLLSSLGTEHSVAEAVQIIDSLATDLEADHALGFGLAVVSAGPATRLAWANRGFADGRPENKALLPAATVLVEDRHRSLDEVMHQLRVTYADAEPAERVALARWLLDHQAPEQALDVVRTDEAPASREAFLVRADALSALADWSGLLHLIEAGSPLNPTATFLLRARSERGLGRTVAADASLGRALRSAAARFQLPAALAEVDALGRESLADQIVTDLCGEYATADYALRVARARFSARGEPRLRQQAFAQARTASPQAPVVLDYERREKLMDGVDVDPAETAAALAEEPANMDFRLTHALALLRRERVVEARQTLEPGEAIRHQLEPGQRAIVAAVLGASGARGDAMLLARTIRSAHLTDEEYRLVYTLAASGASGR